MLRKLKNNLVRNITNIPGWRTNRKIVVIESDDWGSVRMPSIEVRDELRTKGVEFSDRGYDNVDTLASSEDLNALFEVLSRFNDKNGNHPVITANTIVGNPDFDKIKASNFTEYYYEPFTDTLEKYYPNENVFGMWELGMKDKVFHPQFHGREHLNAQMWLKFLKADHQEVKAGFEKGLFSMVVEEDPRKRFLDSYNINNKSEQSFVQQSVAEGLKLFEDIFGFKSLSAIAACYTWDPYIEEIYKEYGVKYIQSGRVQRSSINENGKYIRHYTGQKNIHGQIYFVRNAFFEPSQRSGDSVLSCLKEIEASFFWHKPAIISAHRLNFIGALDKSNRDKNLLSLSRLLSKIEEKYPEVEYLTSDELGRLMVS